MTVVDICDDSEVVFVQQRSVLVDVDGVMWFVYGEVFGLVTSLMYQRYHDAAWVVSSANYRAWRITHVYF